MSADPPQVTTSLPPTSLTTLTHEVDMSRSFPTLPPQPLPSIVSQARVPYPSSASLGATFNLPSSQHIPVPGGPQSISSAPHPSNTVSTVPKGSSVVGKRKRTFKVIILGDAGVGKTCLSFRFCNGRFPEFTEATIGVDFRERSVHLEGEALKMQLWDTAGQERYRQSIVAHYYRNVHAVVFVYDVISPTSFNSLTAWLAECDKHGLGANSEVPRILIGNKCDLECTERVNTDMAQIFADRNNMALFETSAKKESEADHVESIFMTLVHHLQRSKAMHVQSERERNDQDQHTLLLKADQAARMQDDGWCC